MTEPRLDLKSSVRQNPAVLSAAVGDAVVLLYAERNAYYDTESVGARVWQQLAAPVVVGDLCRQLEHEFEVDTATCQAEVLAFLEDALTEGIILVDQ